MGFAKFYFQPSNMIISVVSKETPESINSYFANFTKPIPEGTIANPAFIKEFKEISQPININLEGGGEQSYLYYGYQKNIDKNDEAALQVLSLLFSDKIVFDIREKQGMAYRMSAGIDVVNNKAMFNINMGTRPENIDKLIPQLSNFFTKEYLGTISEDEVTKSVNMYLGRMMFRRLSSINQAYYLGYSKYFNNDIFYDSKSLDELKKLLKMILTKSLQNIYRFKILCRLLLDKYLK
ncbi:MAG: insulinase family protein [Ignavibacteriales bacterium]|nr:insulinase family protein [Ignavibacteriales bacterium]